MPDIITKEQLLNNLNDDLKLEYSAALQYVQHAAVISGAEFDAIRVHLLEHADEEFAHAKELSDKINYLGGIPVAAPDLSAIKLSGDARYMLALDLQGEQRAVARYKERIEQAVKLREYGLVQVLQEILAAEEEHENDLLTTLGEGHAAPAQVVAEQYIKLASMEQRRKI
jgi:bacterioferritin